VLRWNGQDRATQFVNGSQVAASITSTDIAAAGIGKVTAFNPGAGGGESAGQIFPVFLNIPPPPLPFSPVTTPTHLAQHARPVHRGRGGRRGTSHAVARSGGGQAPGRAGARQRGGGPGAPRPLRRRAVPLLGSESGAVGAEIEPFPSPAGARSVDHFAREQ